MWRVRFTHEDGPDKHVVIHVVGTVEYPDEDGGLPVGSGVFGSFEIVSVALAGLKGRNRDGPTPAKHVFPEWFQVCECAGNVIDEGFDEGRSCFHVIDPLPALRPGLCSCFSLPLLIQVFPTTHYVVVLLSLLLERCMDC